MLSAYPACFFKEESGYSVVFPDLNDLSTCGETLDESLRMAVDCLAGYLYWLKKTVKPPGALVRGRDPPCRCRRRAGSVDGRRVREHHHRGRGRIRQNAL